MAGIGSRKGAGAPAGGACVAVSRGQWGEDAASAYLQARGWVVLERNARPCSRDRRCEIDIVLRSRDGRSVVFVEVKTHRAHSPFASRLWRVNRRKRNVLLRACTNWIMRNKWHGNFRFDVVEVYGAPEDGMPEIDHIENVPLFPSRWRFW